MRISGRTSWQLPSVVRACPRALCSSGAKSMLRLRKRSINLANRTAKSMLKLAPIGRHSLKSSRRMRMQNLGRFRIAIRSYPRSRVKISPTRFANRHFELWGCAYSGAVFHGHGMPPLSGAFFRQARRCLLIEQFFGCASGRRAMPSSVTGVSKPRKSLSRCFFGFAKSDYQNHYPKG